MNLEAFLEQVRDAGERDSEGAFTTSMERMLERLGQSLLVDDSLAPLVVVAGAVAAQARSLDIVAAKRELRFRLEMDEPEGLAGSAGSAGSGWHAVFHNGPGRHLLMAAAVWRRQAARVSLVFPRAGRQLVLTPASFELGSVTMGEGPVELVLSGKLPAQQTLELLLLRHCGLCSIPLSLRGRLLQVPLRGKACSWTAAVPAHLRPPGAAPLAGELALWLAPSQLVKPPWVAVVGGVSYPFLLPEAGSVQGIVWSERLRTDLSMSGVTWDEEWSAVRAELLRQVAQAGGGAEGQSCHSCSAVETRVPGLCRVLHDRLPDRVFWPGQEAYDREVAGFNTAYQHRVGLVVAAADSADIVEAVTFARQHHLRLGVQATGHGVHEPLTADVLVSTRRFDRVAIDPEKAIATVGAGVIWRSVYQAAEPHGLVPVAGSSPTVGVVGYLLGGGLGPLARSHGFSSDYVEELTVVSGEGRLLKANASENADLFWALRGGKVGLGVVLEVKLRLVRIAQLYAGRLDFVNNCDLELVMRGWLDWTESAPDAATTSLAFAHRGNWTDLRLRLAYPGRPAEAEAALDPLRGLGRSYDRLAPREARYLGALHEDPEEPNSFWVSGLLLTHLDGQFATVLRKQLKKRQTLIGFELRHLGAATRRDVPEGSAVGGREAHFAAAFIWSPQVDLFEDAHARSDAMLREALAPWVAGETNINFAARVRDQAHFDSAWPEEIRGRLQGVRRRYDPDGVFALWGGQG